MSRPRNVSFEVHRPAQAPAAPSFDPGRGLSFTDLLRQRRQAGSARPFGERLKAEPEGRASARELFEGEVPAGIPPVAAQDESEAQAQPEATEEASTDPAWADEIVPGPELLQPLLTGAARVARSAAPTHPTVAAIAQTIARFCNDRAVDDSEGWQVRMPLRPDVLPETTLQLSVSSYWLQLRFETADAKARDLLFTHRDALGTALEESLNRRRDVAIVID